MINQFLRAQVVLTTALIKLGIVNT